GEGAFLLDLKRRARGFFIRPQAPGGRIRALGYAPIRRGGRSALPPLRVGLVCVINVAPRSRCTDAKRRQARPRARPYARKAKRADARARRLRSKKKPFPRPKHNNKITLNHTAKEQHSWQQKTAIPFS